MSTTANTLSFAIYHLAKYPDIQRKARQKVIEVFGEERQDVLPTAEQLKELKYIDMILKEVNMLSWWWECNEQRYHKNYC